MADKKHLREGQAPTGKKSFSQKVKRFLQVFTQLRPHIIWVILVGIALYSYFYPPSAGGVIVFLILIGVASGSLSLSQAITLLRSFPLPVKLLPPAKGQGPNAQSGEQATDEQGKSE